MLAWVDGDAQVLSKSEVPRTPPWRVLIGAELTQLMGIYGFQPNRSDMRLVDGEIASGRDGADVEVDICSRRKGERAALGAVSQTTLLVFCNSHGRAGMARLAR